MTVANTYEVQMLALINAERAAHGLAALRLNSRLNSSAETHSRWMLQADEFSHTGSGGSSAGERMGDAGYVFSGNWTWGENIAYQSVGGPAGISDEVRAQHEGLMNSPGHRANILNPNFVEIGIGIEVGSYENWSVVMVTQNFARSSADNGGPGGGSVPPPPVFLSDGANRFDGTVYNDQINAMGGDDRIDGLAGHDTLRGGNGDDILIGGLGNDRLEGGIGSDLLWGQAANDLLFGGDGNDGLYGGANNDTLSGQAGNDVLSGDEGQDMLNGGDGTDRLSGGAGSDMMAGAAGADSFVFRPGDDADRVTDFADNVDTLVFAGGHWDGAMSVQTFVSTYARVSGSSVIFDFGDGDVVTVNGVTAVARLYDDIQFLA